MNLALKMMRPYRYVSRASSMSVLKYTLSIQKIILTVDIKADKRCKEFI